MHPQLRFLLLTPPHITFTTVFTPQGNNPRATGYHTLMTSLLTEVERGAHKQAVRGVFLSLDVLHKLVGCMGLTVVRHMARWVGCGCACFRLVGMCVHLIAQHGPQAVFGLSEQAQHTDRIPQAHR